jgi:hypothetical protein
VGGRARICPHRAKVLHVRFQEVASWLTPSGVAKKRKMIEAKGMPDLTGRRFLTVTLDPKMFGHCPLTGYLEGKDHMRRFLEAGRVAGLWDRGCWWAWKMEFQRNTWAHWHILLDRTRKFSHAEMRKIHELWGLGRTNVRRISKGAFGYHFKYAFKGVFQEDSQGSGLCVPQWFLDHYEPGFDGSKPASFARARFWQTSKGFYTGKPKPAPEKKEPQTSIVPRPVAEILEDRLRAVVVCARTAGGDYKSSKVLFLGVSMKQFFRVHLWDAENGAGCTLSARSFAIDPHTLKTQLIETNQTWKLQQLEQENRLTLKVALRLRQERRALETC